MHCDGMASGSTSSFPVSSGRTLLQLKKLAPSSLSPTFPSTVRLPNSCVSTETRFGSLKTSAKINDCILQSASEMTFYELLGISQTVTMSEIKQAYKQLARKYHPDVSPPDRVEEYTQKFIRVHRAYETLSDPGRRALYDMDMARGLHFSFSARNFDSYDEQTTVKGEWKDRWQNQVSGLKWRSMYKESEENLSWAAKMRRESEREAAGEEI